MISIMLCVWAYHTGLQLMYCISTCSGSLHNTTAFHITFNIMMVYLTTPLQSCLNMQTSLSASTVNCVIYMALIATLHISPTTISSGTILRLCKPCNCIKHTCPNRKNACISSSWRTSSKFFYTLRMFGGSMIEQTLTQAHYSTKEGTYIIHMIN